MAIPILNHMDFQKVAEIRNVRLHNTTSSSVTSPGEGQIIYDTGSDTLKFYNGSGSWIELGSGSGSVTSVGVTDGYLIDSSGGPITTSGNITIDVDLSELSDMTGTITTSDEVVVNDVSETGKDQGKRKAWSEIISDLSIQTGNIVTDDIADDAVTAAKLADTSVSAGSYTAVDITVDAQGRITAAASGTIATSELANDAVTAAKLADDAVVTANIVDANVTTAKIAADAIDGTKIADDAIDSEHITDGSVDNVHLAGSIANAKLANSSLTIGDSTIALGGTDTSLTGLTDIDLTSGNKTIFDGVGSNVLTIGASGTTITIPGNLNVTGTTTTVDSTTIQITNSFTFEGSTADANETVLGVVDPTADRTINLPDASGTVALTSDLVANEKITKLLSGDGTTTTHTITHGFGTPIVSVQVLDYGDAGTGATYDIVLVEVQRNSDNAVDLIFASAPSATQDYLVLISKFPAAS